MGTVLSITSFAYNMCWGPSTITPIGHSVGGDKNLSTKFCRVLFIYPAWKLKCPLQNKHANHFVCPSKRDHTPAKTNISPEKFMWLEDDVPFEMLPFRWNMSIFGGANPSFKDSSQGIILINQFYRDYLITIIYIYIHKCHSKAPYEPTILLECHWWLLNVAQDEFISPTNFRRRLLLVSGVSGQITTKYEFLYGIPLLFITIRGNSQPVAKEIAQI